MNITVRPRSLRYSVEHDSFEVGELHQQYVDLVKLMDGQTTIVADIDDFIVETVISLIDGVPRLPAFRKVYVAQVMDSLIFVFLQYDYFKGNRTVKIPRLRADYAVIFSGISNIIKRSES